MAGAGATQCRGRVKSLESGHYCLPRPLLTLAVHVFPVLTARCCWRESNEGTQYHLNLGHQSHPCSGLGLLSSLSPTFQGDVLFFPHPSSHCTVFTSPPHGGDLPSHLPEGTGCGGTLAAQCLCCRQPGSAPAPLRALLTLHPLKRACGFHRPLSPFLKDQAG